MPTRAGGAVRETTGPVGARAVELAVPAPGFPASQSQRIALEWTDLEWTDLEWTVPERIGLEWTGRRVG